MDTQETAYRRGTKPHAITAVSIHPSQNQETIVGQSCHERRCVMVQITQKEYLYYQELEEKYETIKVENENLKSTLQEAVTMLTVYKIKFCRDLLKEN